MRLPLPERRAPPLASAARGGSQRPCLATIASATLDGTSA